MAAALRLLTQLIPALTVALQAGTVPELVVAQQLRQTAVAAAAVVDPQTGRTVVLAAVVAAEVALPEAALLVAATLVVLDIAVPVQAAVVAVVLELRVVMGLRRKAAMAAMARHLTV